LRKTRIGGKNMVLTNDMISRKIKKLLSIFCLLSISTLVGLGIGEMALRIVLPRIGADKHAVTETDDVLSPDSRLGHRLIPNEKEGHDSNGFKNAMPVRDEYDIVALGDSHTYGQYANGIAEDISWPRFVAEKTGLRVYNMGIWGYGTAQYYALLEQALSFSPKIIIVGLYVGNDIFNAEDVVYHYQGWDEWRNPSVLVLAQNVRGADLKSIKIPLKKVRDWLNKKSVLYDFVGDRTRTLREKIGLSKPRNVGTHDWTTNDPDVSLIYDERSELETRFWLGSRLEGVNLDNPAIAEGLNVTMNFLAEMKKKTDEKGVRLVVALIPMKEAVYGDLIREKAMQNDFLQKTLFFEDRIRETLREFCGEQTMDCLDMHADLFASLQAGNAIYRTTWDEHPTPLGYRAYADSIVRFLQTTSLIVL